MENEQATQQQQPSVPQSMAEYKAARAAGQPVQAEAKPAETTQESATSASEPTTGETAAPESASEKATQETQAPKRDRSAAGRAKELVAEGRVDEALKILTEAAKKGSPRAARELEELQDPRTRKPEQQTAEPAKQETAHEKKARKAFLEEYFKANPAASYEDGLDAYDDSQRDALFAEWDKRQDERREKEKAKAREREQAEAFERRKDEAREKYADFDEVYEAGIQQAEGIPLNPGWAKALHESEIAGELLYHYSKNVAELRQIAAMTPEAAYRATLRQELKLAMPVEKAATPGKPIIPPSAAPAPMASVGGGAANGNPKSPMEARSMAEYKKLRSS